MNNTFSQGSLLWPREAFQAKIDRSIIRAFPGQSFWVTNSEVEQASTRVVMIARSGKKVGWGFRLEDANRLFHTGENVSSDRALEHKP